VPVRLLLATLFAVALLLPACGGTGSRGTDRGTLILDFTPNAVHAGIYTAVARDFDGAEQVELRVRPPAESADSVRLLEAGRAEMAILSISDLALARAQGRDLVAVMAFVQRPLAAVLARPQIRSPRDLVGRRAGVAGLPSDDAVLDSVVRGAGADPARVRKVNIGFTAVPSLLSGRVAAATGFWNVEGRALRREGGRRFREFRVDRFGAPRYPELVLVVTRETLHEDRDVVEHTVRALRRGYEETLLDPPLAVEAMLRSNRGLDREELLDGLQAVQRAFKAPGERFGELDRDRLEAWARWTVKFGLVDEPPDVPLAFDFKIAG
jgi:putative hydroxymethylpyrimidine transport system substrate-binding protein